MPLARVDGVFRTFAFAFPNAAPGEYFVIACFDFGCGDYRKRATGDLVPVRIGIASVSTLHFGL